MGQLFLESLLYSENKRRNSIWDKKRGTQAEINRRLRLQAGRPEAQNTVRIPLQGKCKGEASRRTGERWKLQGQLSGGGGSQEEVTSFLLLVNHTSRMFSPIAVSNERELLL